MKLKNVKAKSVKTFWLTCAIYLLPVLVVVAAAIYLVGHNYIHGQPKAGDFVSGYSQAPDSYKNLDLRIASQATYSGSPITVFKDLGLVRGVSHKLVHFSVAKDKLVEAALLTLPSAPPPSGGYPVIVLCHGYVNPLYYSTEKAYLGDMEFYSQHGFAVIKPDYRGQGFSIGHGTADGAYYSMSYNTDVMSLIADIKSSPNFNKSQLNLWGHSMGAYIALRAAVLESDIKNTILLSGPVGTIEDMYTSYVAISDADNPVAGAVRAKQLSLHGTPVSDPSYWNTASPISYLANNKSFIQIHVGTADAIVPPHFSADLDSALSKLGQPHEYFIYPGGDHGLGRERQAIYQRSLSRLDS